jgi:hypothetical protein
MATARLPGTAQSPRRREGTFSTCTLGCCEGVHAARARGMRLGMNERVFAIETRYSS